MLGRLSVVESLVQLPEELPIWRDEMCITEARFADDGALCDAEVLLQVVLVRYRVRWLYQRKVRLGALALFHRDAFAGQVRELVLGAFDALILGQCRRIGMIVEGAE